MSFVKKLKDRWGIKSTGQVILILIVFALTGFSFLYVEEFIIGWLNLSKGASVLSRIVFFILFTLPVYNALLLVYGIIFGQFRFFWNFEKRFFGRLFRPFKRTISK